MFCHVFTTIDELEESVFNNGVYDNLGEAGLFVIRTIFSIWRIFWLCFWKWDLYAAELRSGFCMTNVRMYIKKGYGGGWCAHVRICAQGGWSSIFCVRMYLFGFV